VLPRLLHVLCTWRIAEEPSDVYSVEGVEIGRSACPAAESGTGVLGEGEGVDDEGCGGEEGGAGASGGGGVGYFGFGFYGLAEGEEGVVFGAHCCGFDFED